MWVSFSVPSLWQVQDVCRCELNAGSAEIAANSGLSVRRYSSYCLNPDWCRGIAHSIIGMSQRDEYKPFYLTCCSKPCRDGRIDDKRLNKQNSTARKADLDERLCKLYDKIENVEQSSQAERVKLITKR